MIFEGISSRIAKLASGAQARARLTLLNSMAVAQVEPLSFDLSRSGRRFYLGYSAAVTGIAPVQAIPTTAAQWTLFNNEPGGGKAYALETVGAMSSSGTPGVGGVLLGALYQLPVNLGAQAAGFGVQNASNGSAASKMIVKSGVTVTSPAAPIWTPIAENDSPNVGAFPGSATFKNRDLQGKIVIPPQQGLALAVLALAGSTPLWVPFAVWSEIETELE